jgi:hypothetical protein
MAMQTTVLNLNLNVVNDDVLKSLVDDLLGDIQAEPVEKVEHFVAHGKAMGKAGN